MVLSLLVTACSTVSDFRPGVGDGRREAPLPTIQERYDRFLRISEGRLAMWRVDAPPEEVPGYLGIGMTEVEHSANVPETPSTVRLVPEVTAVVPGWPADRADIRVGDRIVAAGGDFLEPRDGLPSTARLSRMIRKTGPSQPLALTLYRDGKSLEKTVLLSLKPRAPVVCRSHPELDDVSTIDRKPSAFESLLAGEEGIGGQYAGVLRRFADASGFTDDPFRPSSFFRLTEMTYVLNHPLALAPVAAGMVEDLDRLLEIRSGPAAFVKKGLESLDIRVQDADGNLEPPSSFLVRLVDALVRAKESREAVMSGLTPEERAVLFDGGRKIFASMDNRMFHENDKRTVSFIHAAERVDLEKLLGAGLMVAEALESAGQLSKESSQWVPDPLPPGWRVNTLNGRTRVVTPAGVILLGSMDADRHEDGAEVIIDPGGDDVYAGCPGGSSEEEPFRVVIDLGGDDEYRSEGPFCQGAGFFGAGFIIDLEGDDQYTGGDLAQGVSVFGVGGLMDYAGEDRYQCRIGCQGTSAFGVGVLADFDGDDRYESKLFAQGVGQVKGYGLLADRLGDDGYSAGELEADHRDPEHATRSFAQGFGMGNRPGEQLVGTSGGIGILFDGNGDDNYSCDYFGQGSGYWFGLGVLADRSGNDRYRAGRYAQGAGIHFAGGILLDDDGDDVYRTSHGVSQGCGHDAGVGMLLEGSGSDEYRAGRLAQGAGNAEGIGVLLDVAGDDAYEVEEKGQGYVTESPDAEAGGLGLLLDAGNGSNRYSTGPPEGVRFRSGLGIFSEIR